MKPTTKGDPFLAAKWPASKVDHCLKQKQEEELIAFLRDRYTERFFQPIRYLKQAPGNDQGYGMAMMSLCSLLVESIQCCRDGLPTTSRYEWTELDKLKIPATYDVPKTERKTGPDAFQDFFKHFASLFAGVDGKEFYENIRNGLLHQAQTKGGWTIRIDGQQLCDPNDKVINRNLFACHLEQAFETYLNDLRASSWADDVWQKAARRIGWLIRLSR